MVEKINQLLQLIKENPELPVMTAVNCECAYDDGNYLTGQWYSVGIEEYTSDEYRPYFKFDAADRKIIRKQELWEKAIVIRIEP